jgi:hypothetical protein
MDKDLQHVLDKANKHKANRPKENEPELFSINEPYDYVVFTKLVFMGSLYPVIFLVVIPAILCVGFFITTLSNAITILILYSVCIALYYAFTFIRYHYLFKGWKEKLPFTLNGWDELIRSKKMFCDLCWNDVEIYVTPHSSATPINYELIEASLLLFCNQSKKAFYTKKAGSQSTRNRQDWKVTSSLSAAGSANPQVMRYMKNLFEKDLSVIALKTNSQFVVTVVNVSEEFEVMVEINRGNN